MEKSMNKRIIAIVAVIALVAILGVCLVACDKQETYENRLKDKDYVVVSMTAKQLEDIVGDEADEVDWAIVATKVSEESYVCIIKFKNENAAKDCVDEALEELEGIDGFTAERSGKVIFVGTEQAVKDAK